MSSAHYTYLKVLKLLRKKYGRNEKWSDELDQIMTHLFGNKAKKTVGYEYDPKRRNGYFPVIYTSPSYKQGVHWVGVYQQGKYIFVYDSFGRHANHILEKFVEKMQSLGYSVIDVTHVGDQGQYQEDCGLRAVTWLYLVKIGGLKYALTIHEKNK